MANPWKTSQDIIDTVKRKIMLPLSQITFTENDVLTFANEEMMISEVPSVLSFNEEYFVIFRLIELLANTSRYAIPNRAIGMKLRDLFWADTSGNLYEMARIDEHNKAANQRTSSMTTVYKFYPEGNDIVLVPAISTAVIGNLVPVFYLRPNQLVKTDRACTITAFKQTIKINYNFIQALDIVTINDDIFTAVNSLGGTITNISVASSTILTSTNHHLTTGQNVTIASSNSSPSINGSYIATVIDANTFSIPIEVGTAGTSATFTSTNQFLIGSSNSTTATNLAGAISAVGSMLSVSSSSDVVTINFSDFQSDITTSRTVAFVIPTTTIGITFDQLPSTYTDNETNITEDMFVAGAMIDFLQTKPGHKIYTYDIEIPTNGISGTTITFTKEDLKVPSTSSGSSYLTMILPDLQINDYICMQNECIIPQIPPDLHTDLCERTAARLLFALNDQTGLQNSTQRLAEIDAKKHSLLSNRVEGTSQKVTLRKSLASIMKIGYFRKY